MGIKVFIIEVGRKGFEPSTFRLSVERSTKLSYRPCFYDFLGFCFSNINVVSNLYIINYICQKLEYMAYIHREIPGFKNSFDNIAIFIMAKCFYAI
jgi:hypothetical protein